MGNSQSVLTSNSKKTEKELALEYSKKQVLEVVSFEESKEFQDLALITSGVTNEYNVIPHKITECPSAGKAPKVADFVETTTEGWNFNLEAIKGWMKNIGLSEIASLLPKSSFFSFSLLDLSSSETAVGAQVFHGVAKQTIPKIPTLNKVVSFSKTVFTPDYIVGMVAGGVISFVITFLSELLWDLIISNFENEEFNSIRKHLMTLRKCFDTLLIVISVVMIIFAIGSLIGAIATGGWSIVIQMLLSTFAVAVGCVLGQIAAAIVIKGLHKYFGDSGIYKIADTINKNWTLIPGLHFTVSEFDEDHLTTGCHANDDGFLYVGSCQHCYQKKAIPNPCNVIYILKNGYSHTFCCEDCFNELKPNQKSYCSCGVEVDRHLIIPTREIDAKFSSNGVVNPYACKLKKKCPCGSCVFVGFCLDCYRPNKTRGETKRMHSKEVVNFEIGKTPELVTCEFHLRDGSCESVVSIHKPSPDIWIGDFQQMIKINLMKNSFNDVLFSFE